MVFSVPEVVKLLAVDLGASGGKYAEASFDPEEGVLRLEVNRFPNSPVTVRGHRYWDVLHLWERISSVLAHSEARSVGIDSWGVDFALLDDNDELLFNPYSYREYSDRGLMQEVMGKLGKERIYGETGIQFMPFNSLYQLYALFKAGKLQRVATLLMIPDLFNFWLTGKKAVERTNATTTQFFNSRKGEWCYDLLEDLGLKSTDFLPQVVEPGRQLGRVEPVSLPAPASVESGPLLSLPAAHDTASAIAGAPMVGPGVGYISSGTWDLIGLELSNPVINGEALSANFSNEGGAFDSVDFLRNAQGMWIIQGIGKDLEEAGTPMSFDEMTRKAAQAEDVRGFVDVDDPSLLAPPSMSSALRELLTKNGHEVPKDVGWLIRLVLKSLALKRRHVLKKAEALTGERLRAVNVVGGGSRNWLLNQMTADALGLPVVAGPEEATAAGNLLVQLSALGFANSLSQLREIASRSFALRTYYPSDAGQKAMEDAYADYAELMGDRGSGWPRFRLGLPPQGPGSVHQRRRANPQNVLYDEKRGHQGDYWDYPVKGERRED